MRPSFEALPSWLSRLPEVPPTPVRAYRPPDESVLQRALANPRLPVHVGVLAIALGIGAAVAAGSVRANRAAESHAQMSAYAETKAAELRSFTALRSARTKMAASPLAPGGSLTTNVPGYFDIVEGTDGRRFYRRWDVDAAPTGSRRIVVRLIPASPRAGRDSLDVTSIIPPPMTGRD
jgi:hypothetical protein